MSRPAQKVAKGGMSCVLTLATTSLVLGITRLPVNWWHEQQANLAASKTLGGHDPSPVSNTAAQLLNGQTLSAYISNNPDWPVWLIATGLTLAFLVRRRGEGLVDWWWDGAFFSSALLFVTYHRYYDAALLLLLLPLLVELWRARRLRLLLLFGLCLLVLAFPIQTVFARAMGAAALTPSLAQFALLRIQPLAILAITATLALAPQRAAGTRI